jgi:beta-lactamase regulating signal transducer with metallopeptidase domain
MSRRSRRLLIGLAGLGAGLTGCEAGKHADAALSLQPTHVLLAGSALFGAAMVVLIVASIVRQAMLHARAAASLRRVAQPAMLHGRAVGVVEGIGGALVAGIVTPATYCSPDLVTRLDDDELHGVLLHERHHEATRAPARLIVIGGIDGVIGRLPVVAALLERVRAAIEIAADEAAVKRGVSRRALASAILKVDRESVAPDGAAFASATELRLMALVGQQPPESTVRETALPLVTGVSLAVAACAILAVLLPGA